MPKNAKPYRTKMTAVVGFMGTCCAENAFKTGLLSCHPKRQTTEIKTASPQQANAKYFKLTSRTVGILKLSGGLYVGAAVRANGVQSWEIEGKSGAFANLAFHVNGPLKLLHDSVDDRKS